MRYISPISRTYPRGGESRLWAAPGAYRYRSVHDGAAAWPGALAKLGYHLTYASWRICLPFVSPGPLSLSFSLSSATFGGTCTLRHPPTYPLPPSPSLLLALPLHPRGIRSLDSVTTSTCTFSLSSRESSLIALPGFHSRYVSILS